MKIKSNIYNNFCILLCVFLFVGCKSKSQAVSSEEAKNVYHHDTENSEKQNLLDLPSDSDIIPLEHPKYGVINGFTPLIESVSAQDDSIFQLIENIPDEIDSLNSQAYRVQLFSSKNFGESRNAKLIAEEIFDRPVFLDYEVPYYKIRVGNFSNREKAEEYQQRAKTSGYKNAWVVVVIVNIKETSPMYDELLTPQVIDSLINQIETENKSESNENE